jgi:hypothetical protein
LCRRATCTAQSPSAIGNVVPEINYAWPAVQEPCRGRGASPTAPMTLVVEPGAVPATRIRSTTRTAHVGGGMTDSRWVTVPIGTDSTQWASGAARRTVLGVIHNVTSLTRLLDVLSVCESDPRIQVVFSWTRSSPFTHGVPDFLTEIGALVIPWEQAVATRFDLAVASSYGGDLHNLRAPLVVVSHGVGYNKIEPGTRNQEPGTRNQEPGTRNQEPGTRNQEPGTRNQEYSACRHGGCSMAAD